MVANAFHYKKLIGRILPSSASSFFSFDETRLVEKYICASCTVTSQSDHPLQTLRCAAIFSLLRHLCLPKLTNRCLPPVHVFFFFPSPGGLEVLCTSSVCSRDSHVLSQYFERRRQRQRSFAPRIVMISSFVSSFGPTTTHCCNLSPHHCFYGDSLDA